MEENDILQDLCGLELSTVIFIRDYMQFVFDPPNSSTYPSLTIYNDPYVILDGSTYERRNNEFCNRILTFIGMQVMNTKVVKNEYIRIEFTNNGSINISLKPEDYRGPEVASLTIDEHRWNIW